MVGEKRAKELKDRNEYICKLFNQIHRDDNKKLSSWAVCEEIRKELLFQKIDLTQTYIYQLVMDMLIIDREYEKKRRILKLQRLEKDKTATSKDLIDILEQERREIEGDRPLVHQESHIHYTIEVQDVKADGRKENTIRFTSKPEDSLAR